MILIVLTTLTMLAIVVLAAAVVLYVAYPHRGQDVPSVPWVGDAMRRGVARLPTVDNLRGGHRPRPGTRARQCR
ncbi:MAG: hypothetical protein QOF53_465 [Nocardioidaceae bacterium]|nr:hypothetical protein [Nocardioidaceae bacterium]